GKCCVILEESGRVIGHNTCCPYPVGVRILTPPGGLFMPQAVQPEANATFEGYAHPEVLVSTEWLAEHLDDPNIVILESDEDLLLYELGHIPGALKLDWETQMQQPVIRDFVDKEGFEQLASERGI